MNSADAVKTESNIKTRFLIISDTHGQEFCTKDAPFQHADVAIHCGDLTDGSKLDEFRSTISLLKAIDAPLKLVIPGNHDFTLDIPAFEKKVAEATLPLDLELVARHCGTSGEARQLFEEAEGAAIIFLDEGTRSFTLKNGALLNIFASPWTPSLGAWGFQYHPNHGHEFSIDKGVDLVITHGPPKGIMDYTHRRERAGCSHLFAAVTQARPKLHCVGHIHEGWGAKLVTWRPETGDNPSHFTDIDNERSFVIETLGSLTRSRFDSPKDVEAKAEKMEIYRRQRCCTTSYCVEDARPLERGAQTLFVNASIMGTDGTLVQNPWLVDIDLSKA